MSHVGGGQCTMSHVGGGAVYNVTCRGGAVYNVTCGGGAVYNVTCGGGGGQCRMSHVCVGGGSVPCTHLWLSTQSKVNELYIPITVQQEVLLGGGGAQYMSPIHSTTYMHACTYIHFVPHVLVCTQSTYTQYTQYKQYIQYTVQYTQY